MKFFEKSWFQCWLICINAPKGASPPQAGFEPTTFRLTADGSTIELLRST